MMTWYTGDPTYDTVLTFAFVLVLFVFIGGALMKSPYGRFASDKWGVNLSPRLGWFLMELPAMLSFVFFYFQGRNRFELVPLFFLLVWVVHYGNRGFVFPYLIRSPKGATASFSITIVVMGTSGRTSRWTGSPTLGSSSASASTTRRSSSTSARTRSSGTSGASRKSNAGIRCIASPGEVSSGS
jgi:hypothetical protein